MELVISFFSLGCCREVVSIWDCGVFLECFYPPLSLVSPRYTFFVLGWQKCPFFFFVALFYFFSVGQWWWWFCHVSSGFSWFFFVDDDADDGPAVAVVTVVVSVGVLVAFFDDDDDGDFAVVVILVVFGRFSVAFLEGDFFFFTCVHPSSSLSGWSLASDCGVSFVGLDDCRCGSCRSCYCRFLCYCCFSGLLRAGHRKVPQLLTTPTLGFSALNNHHHCLLLIVWCLRDGLKLLSIQRHGYNVVPVVTLEDLEVIISSMPPYSMRYTEIY